MRKILRKTWRQKSVDWLGVDMTGKSVNITIDIFDRLSSKMKKEYNTRIIFETFTYLALISCLYYNGCYPDVVPHLQTNDRVLGSLGMYKNKNIRKLSKKFGELDNLGLVKTIKYRDLPIRHSYENYKKTGKKDDLFNYVRDYDFFLQGELEYSRENIKKPMFCLNQRFVNKKKIKGSFYDSQYTVNVKASDIFTLIYDYDLSAEMVGVYYFFLFESKKYGNKILKFSNEDFRKFFPMSDDKIRKIIDILDKDGIIELVRVGQRRSKRILKINEVS